ncbi:transposase [Lysinibacillus sphaericus OT4b.31]|uniref:Transposase n=1 Tax=Lysinibacillus sphaericus OT4b.31 TaxID=1285586 RepID=R7ZKC4_LYSSH|nr:transposase [Lysinibacillus sphaericus OT4b.31]
MCGCEEKYGMRWTTFRRIKKLSMQAVLTFTAMDLKKLVYGHSKVLKWQKLVKRSVILSLIVAICNYYF